MIQENVESVKSGKHFKNSQRWKERPMYEGECLGMLRSKGEQKRNSVQGINFNVKWREVVSYIGKL